MAWFLGGFHGLWRGMSRLGPALSVPLSDVEVGIEEVGLTFMIPGFGCCLNTSFMFVVVGANLGIVVMS